MRTRSEVSAISQISKSLIGLLLTKCRFALTGWLILLMSGMIALVSPAYGQDILFDFDNAPLYSSLPIYQTAGGVTAHLTATGSGYSIQNANVLGFTPTGFAGRILYPNSINLSDICIHFDQPLTAFSIMYCCQELGCDDAATMKVTAYLNGTYVGFNTRTATFPGTWPVDTLSCSFPQGFDSVVVHYYLHPPTCQDYGTIYMADNMRVTPSPVGVVINTEPAKVFALEQNYPNPFNPNTVIKFQVTGYRFVSLAIYDVLGRKVATLVNGNLSSGEYETEWNATNFASGLYFYKIETDEFTRTKKMLLLK